MNSVTTRYWAGLVIRNSDTASGSTSPVIPGGQPNAAADWSIAGRLASELCVPAATHWAGRAAEANEYRFPPRLQAIAYMASVITKYTATSTAT